MRLITRADLDGLTCAVLLSAVETIDDVELAHPKDVQDGKVEITSNDILANLPRDGRAGMVFDHHASQADEWKGEETKGGFAATAPSAARVIASHYSGTDFSAYAGLLDETDRLDSANLDPEDVTDPKAGSWSATRSIRAPGWRAIAITSSTCSCWSKRIPKIPAPCLPTLK